MIKVVKFGGSSLASAEQFAKVGKIITADKERKYVVPSAPGKRNSKDTKVTDMLYACYDIAENEEDFRVPLMKIKERYDSIINGLNLKLSLESEFQKISENFKNKAGVDYAASRGEYLNGIIMAKYLGYEFIDAAEVIFFDEKGNFMPEKTDEILSARLAKTERAVIPGFYGAKEDGTIKTFSRGGSDITGSIVARAVHASCYENWTDVSGFLIADPRIIENPEPIKTITYRELRELSYMGAGVLHEDAVFPVRKANIPINIRNTNRPDDAGTLISSELPRIPRKNKVTGIAGKKGFTAVLVEKSSMNSEIGFGMKMLKIFADFGVSFEHMPTGIDTMSVVCQTSLFEPHRDEIIETIKEELKPDRFYVEDNLALIAVVGQGMAYSRGTAARVMKGLSDARINIKMIDQGSTEINIIVGGDDVDYEAAIRGIYDAVME